MMRSLFSAVSGLKNHQTRMDVIANNIANVNTAAFKSSRVVFQDIFSQTSSSGAAGVMNLDAAGNQYALSGGTNPQQIGLGVKMGSIDVMFNVSAFSRSDNSTDMMINGDGFFIVDTNGQDIATPATGTTPAVYTNAANGGFVYTRAGNFYIDNEENFVTADGSFVMGYKLDPDYEAGLHGEFEPGATAGTTVWKWDTKWAGNEKYKPIVDATSGLVTGFALSNTPTVLQPTPIVPGGGTTPANVISQASDLTQPIFVNPNVDVTGTAYAAGTGQKTLGNDIPDYDLNGDGFVDYSEAEPLLSRIHFEGYYGISVDQYGVVWGLDINNDEKLPIAQVALFRVPNNQGMEKVGSSTYRYAAAAGEKNYTIAGSKGSGLMMTGGLEMSNVDLANEF
ncbi:MAG: flagellar hook-basal body complex protein, partial [Oscillospiraceae bacterium]|nr:flagellar hook-basal body complex protein [Oscillospiraceae bacterium]